MFQKYKILLYIIKSDGTLKRKAKDGKLKI